jgi:hypothetical protein
MVYLGMLDDHARNPNDCSHYPDEESEKYQMFGFTSNGPQWEGVVSEFAGAYNLICIVDQIHELAVTRHRDMVIKHLGAWHRRYEDIYKKKMEYQASAK